MKTEDKPVEMVIAERVVASLRGLPSLARFDLYANWGDENGGLVDDDGNRVSPCHVEVNAGPRSYGGYTSLVADVGIVLEGKIDFSRRKTGIEPETAYGEIVGLLEGWRRDILSAKTALGSESFDPVGLRLDGGGTWEVDRDTKARYFSVKFTVRGRVKKGTIK